MTTIFVALMAGLLAQGADPPPAASADTQIAGAVQAAPDERRAEATVLGYDAAGALLTLRKGTNDLVCLADKPGDEAFSVACYHRDLEPFMARGRELLARGVTGEDREKMRWKEIEDGKLTMPREPRTLYVLTGSGFDATAGKVANPYLRWVIYWPFATPGSSGLSTKPTPGAPWLMFPGTAGAHVMISPPKDGK